MKLGKVTAGDYVKKSNFVVSEDKYVRLTAVFFDRVYVYGELISYSRKTGVKNNDEVLWLSPIHPNLNKRLKLEQIIKQGATSQSR